MQPIRLAALIVLLSVPLAAQTTWHVAVGPPGVGDGSVGAPFSSVQTAIVAAASGDEVRIAPGVYAERIDLLGKAVVVYAAFGVDTVTLAGDGTGPIATLVSGEGAGTVLRALELRGGIGEPIGNGLTAGGGALLVGASARFESCTFIDNEAFVGGGVHATGGAPVFAACVFEANRANRGAGAAVVSALVQFTDCAIRANHRPAPTIQDIAVGTGVGLYLEGVLHGSELVRCRVEGNTSVAMPSPIGVGIYNVGDVRIVDSIVTDNRSGNGAFSGASSGGYGIGLANYGVAVLERCLFENNTRAIRGGAVLDLGVLQARDCTFRANGGAEGGAVRGGVYESCLFEENVGGLDGVYQGEGGAANGATLIRCLLQRNYVVSGAGQSGGAAHACDLLDCEVVGNTAPRGGGTSFGTVRRSVLRDNVALSIGGGAYGGVLHDCTVTGNHADEGGGQYLGAAWRTTFAGNRAWIGGGGVGFAALTRCVLFDNEAPRGAGALGGSMHFTTVTRNRSDPGSGAIHTMGPFTFVLNSIVSGNDPQAFSGVAEDLMVSWSLVSGGAPGAGNFDGDPRFLGPESGDVHLGVGSAAIDAGDPTQPLDPDGSRADVGAFPFDPNHVFSAGLYCVPKLNSLGCEPLLAVAGEPSLGGADDFELIATNVTGDSFAIATVGMSASHVPLAGGVVCVGALSARLGPVSTGGVPGAPTSCAGEARLGISHPVLSALGVGSLGYSQVFFRDAQHPDGSGLAMTRAVEFRVRL